MSDNHIGQSNGHLALRPKGSNLPAPLESANGSPIVYLEPADPQTPSSAPATVAYFVQLLVRRRLAIASFALAGALASLLWTGIQTPMYRATSLLEILSLSDTSNGFDLKGSGGPQFDAQSYLLTQLSVIKSRTLKQRVLNDLEKAELKPQQSRRLWESWAEAANLKEPIAIAKPATDIEQIKVDAVNPLNTRLMAISVESPDPAYTTQFANALVREYMLGEVTARWDSAQRNTEWITPQLRDLKSKMAAAEIALREFDQGQNLLVGADKRDPGENQLDQLQTNLMAARADRVAKQSLYEQSKKGAAPGQPGESPRVTAYHLRLMDLKRTLAELNAAYTPQYYKVKDTQTQIRELEAALQAEVDSVTAALRADYEAAARREQLVEASFGEQRRTGDHRASARLQHDSLQREVDSLHALYDDLYRKVREGGIASASKTSSVRIVDAAETPKVPFSPRTVWNGALGLAGGLFLGLAWIVGRDWIKQSFSSPGEAPRHLGVPELGVVLDAGRIAGKRSVALSQKFGVDQINRQMSAMKESFRYVVTSILAMGNRGQRSQVILSTSPGPGDGKSTAAAIVAIALAEVNKKVIVIDADLRKSTLHTLFGVENERGLSDILLPASGRKTSSIDECLRKTNVAGIRLLTSGSATTNITTLLHSNRMRELLDYLRDQCDMILIDAPPLLTVSDACILGQYCDGAVMMIRANKTSRDEATASAEMLPRRAESRSSERF